MKEAGGKKPPQRNINKNAVLSGVDKAAIFIMTLDEDVAAAIIEKLDEEEMKELSHAMAHLGQVSPDIVAEVVRDFKSHMSDTVSVVGNVKRTEDFLIKALGKDRVEVLLEEIRGPAGRNIWAKLANVNEEVLANYLKNEYPQTTALILTKLPSGHVAKVLANFSNDYGFEVVKRMIVMDPVKNEVLENVVVKNLRNEFISKLSKIQKQDSYKKVADTFNQMERTVADALMTRLNDYDKESAEIVKNLMFTFDDIVKLDKLAIQSILKNVDNSKLPVALKGAPTPIREMFLNNMSQRAAKILQDEIETMGPVRLKDVDEAQGKIIAVIKDLIESGDIEAPGAGKGELIY
jgi:flagellar motor switch protein FliG